MKKHRLLRFVVYGAAALVALGAIGYAANGGAGSRSHGVSPSTGDEFSLDGSAGSDVGGTAATDGVQQSIAPMPPSRDSVTSNEAVKAGGGSAGPAAVGPNAGTPAIAPQSKDQAAGGDALASTTDRKIVQTATMSLQVKDVGGGFEEAGRIATGAGGFIASSSFSYKGDQQIASVTIRVPASAYQSVLADLRALGEKVDSESSNANDVTEEYTDLGSRQKTLEATQAQLLTLLNKATSISDILTVQDRLNQVQAEIEQIKGRIQLLDNLSDLATITLHLRPVVVVSNVDHGGNVDLGHALSEGWSSSIAFLGGIAEGVVKVLAFAWWIPLAAIPALLIVRALTRRHQPAMPSID